MSSLLFRMQKFVIVITYEIYFFPIGIVRDTESECTNGMVCLRGKLIFFSLFVLFSAFSSLRPWSSYMLSKLIWLHCFSPLPFLCFFSCVAAVVNINNTYIVHIDIRFDVFVMILQLFLVPFFCIIEPIFMCAKCEMRKVKERE